MMKVFPRTRERERAWKLGIYSVLGSMALSPIAILIVEGRISFLEVRSWTAPSFYPLRITMRFDRQLC